MFRRKYWVPSYRWQLEEWLKAWSERTGKPLPNLRKMTKKQLYAIYFSIMDEYVKRKLMRESSRSRL